MRRRPRVVLFARLDVAKLVCALTDGPPSKWPQHLLLAYEILCNELTVPDPAARRLVIDCVSKAHACAQALNHRVYIRIEHEMRIKVRKAFFRLADCVGRAPAGVRRSLDRRIHETIASVIDTEVIDEILDAASAIFAQYSPHEAAQTALRALRVRVLDEGQIVVLKTDYSGLGPASRRSCELALSSLTRTSTSVNAAALFKALGSAIDSDPPDGIRPDASDLLVAYVAAVAILWRQSGLRPSRATHSTNTSYKSRFHRFADLVLTAVAEPASNRHNHNIDEIAQQTWAAHARLPLQIRPKISCALKREDIEWLVSEDHIRKAKRLPAQKIGRDTP